jgi:hypothetical protein
VRERVRVRAPPERIDGAQNEQPALLDVPPERTLGGGGIESLRHREHARDRGNDDGDQLKAKRAIHRRAPLRVSAEEASPGKTSGDAGKNVGRTLAEADCPFLLRERLLVAT